LVSTVDVAWNAGFSARRGSKTPADAGFGPERAG
jgi:hypothetical protein